jgi:hypothetical protein
MPEPRSNLLQCPPSLRLGLGDHMYPAKGLKGGPAPGSKHASLDEMILDADGFAGAFPKHKYKIVKRLQGLSHLCAMTDDGANDAPALSHASVSIAVEGATDATHDTADIVLTEPGLSTIVHVIHGSCIIFQRMRNYSIYACAVTIRIVVCFAIPAFTYKFNFPPFTILVITLLIDGTIMALSVDRVLSSPTPDSWDLGEIFAVLLVCFSSLPSWLVLAHLVPFRRGSTRKQGEAEGVVLSTGASTFFGRAASLVGQDDDTTGHLQKILAQISSFCLATIGTFVILEILVLYPAYHYTYRDGLGSRFSPIRPTSRSDLYASGCYRFPRLPSSGWGFSTSSNASANPPAPLVIDSPPFPTSPKNPRPPRVMSSRVVDRSPAGVSQQRPDAPGGRVSRFPAER